MQACLEDTLHYITAQYSNIKFALLPKCGYVAQLAMVLNLYLGGMGLNPTKAWIFQASFLQ